MIPDTRPFVLTLTGARGIRQAAETHAELLAAMRAHADIVLDCDGVTEADLSFIQLIAACHRSAATEGWRFAVQPSPTGAVLAALTRCGVSAAQLCGHSAGPAAPPATPLAGGTSQ